MNVGYLCAEYPSIDPNHGGIGSAVQTLAHALCGAGHQATIFSLARSEKNDAVAGSERSGGRWSAGS